MLLSAWLGGCVTTASIPTDYVGTDAGHVVLGFGAEPGLPYS